MILTFKKNVAFSNVGGINKCSFIDFPDTISAVIFFNYCNLKCPYCHNPGIVNCTDTIDNTTATETIKYIVYNKVKLGIEGIVLSGGEPTIQKNITQYCSWLKHEGLKVKLDTNGLNSLILKSCDVDYIAMDLKTYPDNYSILGKSNFGDTILESLKYIGSLKENAELRLTFVRGFFDTDKDSLYKIGCLIYRYGIKRVFIQKPNMSENILNPGFAKGYLPFTDEELSQAAYYLGAKVR